MTTEPEPSPELIARIAKAIADAFDADAPDTTNLARAALVALQATPSNHVERLETYAEWQQKRGMLADKVDWAINEYDEFMADDAYDAQRVLDRIAEGLRETRQALADAPNGGSHG